jgi:tRNA nucleotidyltransferase (CCA-adding enzyme)
MALMVHAAPEVTLEEDLARRDLTVNSIAVKAHWESAGDQFNAVISNNPGDWRDSGDLQDPYGGVADLHSRTLRHVSPAFREDPVRLLRLARFAARFNDFEVAAETRQLLRLMVDSGELDHLVPERVWQELARGLLENTPSRMFAVLRDCGALARLLPEVDQLWGVPQRADYHPEVDTGVHLMLVLDMCARLKAPLAVRVACLFHDLGKGTTPPEVLPRHIGHEQRSAQLLKAVCDRLRVPTDCRELADVVAREHSNVHRSSDFSAGALVRLIERCDGLRKPQRFEQLLMACECDARGRLGLSEQAYPQRKRLLGLLTVMQEIDTQSIAENAISTGVKGSNIGELIHLARIAAVQQRLG